MAQLADAVAKRYFSDRRRYAEICNAVLFHGTQTIKPEFLTDLNPRETNVTGMIPKHMHITTKERDILKLYEGDLRLMILGIENQNHIHYCMPVRNFLYDALEYERQWNEISKKHMDQKDLDGNEYISGFSKDDRLSPVFTIVLYLGAELWDGPVTLYEMLDLSDEAKAFQKLITDYRLNLLCVNQLEDLNQFSADLKLVFGVIKYQKDKKAMTAFLSENREIFRTVDLETLQAVAVFGKISNLEKYLRQKENEKGEYDMNQAIMEMIEDGRNEGIEMERENGIKILIQTLHETNISVNQIIEKVVKKYMISEEEVKAYIEQLA